MAKSSRASSKKTNKSSLRSKVFGPVEDARTSRLADKLMEIATRSAADKDVTMDGDGAAAVSSEAASKAKQDDSAMDLGTDRPHRIIKSTEIRDKREKRKGLRKGKSSTTFKSKPAPKGKHK